MTVHVLVEGPSERAFLGPWATKVLKGIAFRVHPHQGKGSLPANPSARPRPEHRGLLDQLPAKLRGFEEARPRPTGVVVLVDADDDDWEELAAKILAVASSESPNTNVIVRIAVEESEAFFLGDIAALKKAYPKADIELARSYEPDSICGTWELLGRVIGDDGGNKVEWAASIGPYLTIDPAKSRSPSFKRLLSALKQLCKQQERPEKEEKRKFRHVAKPKRGDGRRR